MKIPEAIFAFLIAAGLVILIKLILNNKRIKMLLK